MSPLFARIPFSAFVPLIQLADLFTIEIETKVRHPGSAIVKQKIRHPGIQLLRDVSPQSADFSPPFPPQRCLLRLMFGCVWVAAWCSKLA